jgi:hypothetical protein
VTRAATISPEARSLHHPDVNNVGRFDPGIDFESPSPCKRMSQMRSGVASPPAVAHRENAYFRGPNAICFARSVINLQHTDSFDAEPSQTHKNAAIGDGFCLLVFLKMALVLVRRTSAMAMGT